MTNPSSASDPNPHPLEEYYGDTHRIAVMFQWFLGAILIGLTAGIFISVSHHDTLQAVFTGAGMPPVLAAYWLVRRQKFEAASVLLAVVLIALITVVSAQGLGIHHLSVLGYPAILIIASLVTRKSTMIWLTVYTIVCIGWLVFGELSGAYTPAVLEKSVPGDFFTASIILVMTAVMVRMVSEALFQSNIRYRRELQERQMAQQALAVSEKRFYEVFHASPVMMTIEGPDHRFIDVNPAFCDALGFSRDEVLGRIASELNLWASPEDVDRVRSFTTARTKLKNLELSFRRRSGEVGAALMSSDTFEVNGVGYELTSALDITDRKRIEAEREELIAELKAKNAELEQFTYTVSHDLKSPIITVKGFLGFLEQDLAEGKPERIHDDVTRINEAMDKMNRLLGELLELSRIGRLMNPPQAIPFEEIVQEALKIVHGQVESRGITVQVEAGLPVVHGDRQRLTEVLQNLLDNAAKFMGEQAQPRIEVGQRGEEDGKPVLFVRDNGIGVAPEFHERIFGLFNKLDPKIEGTGVGLALVKRIIEFHGGRIWVESKAGQGAAFLFTLPVTGALPKPASRL